MADDCILNTIDSNITGLRYAEEECLGRLPSESDPTYATGRLAVTGTGSGNDDITIGSRTYTLVAALSTGPTVPDEILVGLTAAATAANIVAALNAGPGIGTDYSTGTVVNVDVSAELDGTDVLLTAKTPGAAGNSVATTETSTDLTFDDSTLEGGADAAPITPTWYPLEPNSYSDFGGQIATVARNPINPSRQRKKGVTTDLDASGGFNQDLTFSNTTRLLQGFFFADAREKPTTAPLNGDAVALTGVATSTYTAAGADMPDFVAGDILLASGFAAAANNGVKTVASRTSTTAVVNETLATETPDADARLDLVGHQFASGDLSVVMNGSLVRLTSAAFDLRTLGVIPGEWVFVGGDEATTQFADNAPGYARVGAVTQTYLELDKVSWEATADAGAGKTLRVYLGMVIRNEPLPEDIVRRTYQVERTLGSDTDGTMSEYLVGAAASEFTLNIAQADKVTADVAFVATDNEQRSGLQGQKAGTRPLFAPDDAFNTSSDFSRIKLALVTADDAAPEPLFAFATEISLSINNNVSPNKAIGRLGAIEVTSGTFEVSGSVTAYFASIAAVQAVRNNADVTVDMILQKPGRALLLDVPLLSLGDGRLNVEQDQPITLPLETNAAESRFGHTLLFQSFSHLPAVAGG